MLFALHHQNALSKINKSMIQLKYEDEISNLAKPQIAVPRNSPKNGLNYGVCSICDTKYMYMYLKSYVAQNQQID
jgi:hypothetical protein